MKDSRGTRRGSEGTSDSGEESRRTIPVREFAKRLLSTGVDAVHLTEEGLKQMIGDVNPREAVGTLFDTVSKGTDTLQAVLIREARRYLDAINLRDELGDLLENYTIHVEAQLHFEPREKSHKKKGRSSKSSRRKEARVETERFNFKLVPKEEREKSEDGSEEETD